MINTPIPTIAPQIDIGIFVSDIADIDNKASGEIPISYSDVPRSVAATLTDD